MSNSTCDSNKNNKGEVSSINVVLEESSKIKNSVGQNQLEVLKVVGYFYFIINTMYLGTEVFKLMLNFLI